MSWWWIAQSVKMLTTKPNDLIPVPLRIWSAFNNTVREVRGRRVQGMDTQVEEFWWTGRRSGRRSETGGRSEHLGKTSKARQGGTSRHGKEADKSFKGWCRLHGKCSMQIIAIIFLHHSVRLYDAILLYRQVNWYSDNQPKTIELTQVTISALLLANRLFFFPFSSIISLDHSRWTSTNFLLRSRWRQ